MNPAPRAVVVTGAGGFVGARIAGELASRGHCVWAHFRTPRAEPPREAVRVQAAPVDMTALPARIDALVHAASENPAFVSDPDALYCGNLAPARAAFAYARTAGAATVVFLSTMSVYGRIEATLLREDEPPRDPDPYGRAKRDGEAALAAEVAAGLPSGLALRLPGTVGKGSHHNFLSDAWARMRRGETITIHNPSRPFNGILHVADLARFVADRIEAPIQGFHVANLGAVEPLPLAEVVARLSALSGRVAQVETRPGGRPPFLIALDRARNLGYRPATVGASIAAFVAEVDRRY